MATRAPGYRVCLQRRSRQPDLVLLSGEPLLKLQSQLLVGAAILLEGVGDKWLRLNKSIGVQPLAHDNGRSEALPKFRIAKVGPFSCRVRWRLSTVFRDRAAPAPKPAYVCGFCHRS